MTASLKQLSRQMLIRFLREVAESRRDDWRTLMIASLRRTRVGRVLKV